MENPLVTIAIPFYNAEKFILDAIKSIFAQTYQNWELILIDDGSRDNSLAIAKSISDPRVRVISDGLNKRLPYRLNQISDIAAGQYIARMDADDLCSPTRIEKQLKLLQDDDLLDLVGTGIVYVDNDELPEGHSYVPPRHEEICREPGRIIWLCHASVMAKKSWYQRNKYNENLVFSEDFDLWLRTYSHSKFGNVSEPLYYYRLDNSFNLKKQFRARKCAAAFLYDYFRPRSGLPAALRYAAIQYLKFATTLFLFVTGRRRRLMAKRFNKPMDAAELEGYHNEVRFIKSFSLPLKGYQND
jgi:glycosyltransferase involved in cell wall biosynthesis